MSMRMHPSFLK